MFYTRLIILFFLLLPTAALAADWKYAGATVANRQEVAEFFDADSVEHSGKNTVRVWVKSISQKTLNSYSKKHGSDKQYIKNIARKIATGYVPDYFELQPIKKLYSKPNPNGTLNDHIIYVTEEELLANSGDVQETAKLYFEIDCQGKRIAPLSVILYGANGSVSNSSNAMSPKYGHIAPDSSGEWLSLLVCPNH